jgi:hypothetical protein
MVAVWERQALPPWQGAKPSGSDLSGGGVPVVMSRYVPGGRLAKLTQPTGTAAQLPLDSGQDAVGTMVFFFPAGAWVVRVTPPPVSW